MDRYPRSGAIQTAAGAGDGHNTVNRRSWGCPGRKLMWRSRGLPSMEDAGRTFPLASRPAILSAKLPALSGRGVEGQGRWKCPEGKHIHKLAGTFAHALGSGAEGVDEGTVADAELDLRRIV